MDLVWNSAEGVFYISKAGGKKYVWRVSQAQGLDAFLSGHALQFEPPRLEVAGQLYELEELSVENQ